jgi:hypothetical protein
MAQSKHSQSKWGIERRSGTKGRPKVSRTNIKVHKASLLGSSSADCLQLSSAEVPCFWHLQTPGFSISPWLCFHSFTNCPFGGYSQGIWPCYILSGFGLSLKSGWKLPGPHNSYIPYTCKIGTRCLMPKSCSSWTSLYQWCLSDRELSIVKQILDK